MRTQIDNLLKHSRYREAHSALASLWRDENKASVAGYVSSCYKQLREHLPFAKCRIAFLRSMTVEPLVPLLRSAAWVAGIDTEVHVGQFNSYAQEILDPASQLYSFEPNVVVLAVQTRDILPEIWERYADLSKEEIEEASKRVIQNFSVWIETFRKQSQASLVIHGLEKPFPSQGVLDSQGPAGQTTAVEKFNDELRSVCGEHRGIYMLDYDGLVAKQGRTRWHDENKWLMMRMPFATDSLVPMVTEWMKFIHPLTGNICKVLAVDLDNTLWGGVLGEDGMDGIQLGTEYPGAHFRSLQRAILDLYQRGILLAVCSKNNPDEAMNALRNHPGMLLRPEHFAAFRINWQDKAQNLREIASELNLGIDSIAFLDDNPVERERVSSDVPEVKVIHLPKHAAAFAETLRECPYFERLTISTEDREHTRMYHEQKKRSELADNAGSLEGFYRSLGQEVIIAPVARETLARVAQLTQKTNQFNVTTRRYTEQQIEQFASHPEWSVYSVRVKDRFGDNGIVGVMITKTEAGVREIDTMLLSCRVIGRTIETAMLGFLIDTAKAEGVHSLQGWFLPTKKNAPVRDLYPAHKFRPIATKDEGTLWSLNLEETQISCPEWIELHVSNGSHFAEQARA